MGSGISNPYVERNRKAARTRALVQRARSPKDPGSAAQARLERKMAGVEQGSAQVGPAPTIGEILGRVNDAVAKQGGAK